MELVMKNKPSDEYNGGKSNRKICEFQITISSQFCFIFWNIASNPVFKKLIEAGS